MFPARLQRAGLFIAKFSIFVVILISVKLYFILVSYPNFLSLAYSSEFRQFTIEIIRESFLHLPQPPVNLTAVSDGP